MFGIASFFQQFAGACSTASFLGIPPWYKYLVDAGLMQTDSVTQSCTLVSIAPGTWPKVVILVALAVLDMLLRLAGMIAVGFIIYSGVKYITSNGDTNQSKLAQESMINAVIGVIIAIIAAALVSFVGKTIGG